jgi:hypothetical protein
VNTRRMNVSLLLACRAGAAFMVAACRPTFSFWPSLRSLGYAPPPHVWSR